MAMPHRSFAPNAEPQRVLARSFLKASDYRANVEDKLLPHSIYRFACSRKDSMDSDFLNDVMRKI
jgi:hypothetical protein